MARFTCALLFLVVLLPACRTSEEIFNRGEVLTYEQYQSIRLEDGLTVKDVIDRYGKPKLAHETDGKFRRLIYRCEDSTGRFRDLELVFDEKEVLSEKHL